MNRIAFLLFASIMLTACGAKSSDKPLQVKNEPVKAATPDNLVGCIPAPAGYKRVAVTEGSFAYFLRNLPLKPANSDLHYYNGQVKTAKYGGAIVNMDFGKNANEQCADAIIFLRASYLWQTKQFDKIHFRFG